MLTPKQLAVLAREYGAGPGVGAHVPLRPGERAFECVERTESYDLWLIRWAPNSGTPLHDHGDSAGAVYVVGGELVELRPGRVRTHALHRKTVGATEHHLMSAAHVHSVANVQSVTATSVHAYSPPLDVMHHYEVGADRGLRVIHRELVRANDLAPAGRC